MHRAPPHYSQVKKAEPRKPRKDKPQVISTKDKTLSRQFEADQPAAVSAEDLKRYQEKVFEPLTEDGKGASNRFVLLPADVFPEEESAPGQVGWRSLITKTKKKTVSWFFVKVQDSPNGHWFRFEDISKYQLLSL